MTDRGIGTNEIVLYIAAAGVALAIIVRFSLKKVDTIGDYVWGSGRMSLIPIVLSLFATNISCVSASMVAEFYQYGIHLIFETFPMILTGVFIIEQAKVLLPFRFVSVNEYLVLRFDNKVRLFLSVVFLISQTTYATVIGYSTALQVASFTGISLMNAFLITSYSSLAIASFGGFEGVVWTDAFQALLILTSVVFMSVVGTAAVGGVDRVLISAYETERLSVNFSLDPTIRMTFWTGTLGFFPFWLAFCSLYNPATYQRFASSGEDLVAKQAIFSAAVSIFFKSATAYLGFAMYAFYKGCDPVLSGQLKGYEEIQTLFVEDLSNEWSSLRGIYIVGFISAGISTLTTVINTLGVVIYQDFLETSFNRKGSARKAKIIIVLVEFFMILTSTAVVIFVRNGGSITSLIPLYHSPSSVIVSTFTLGLFVPFVNSRGVLIGSVITLPIALLWTWSSNLATINGQLIHPMKIMKTDDCPFNVTSVVKDEASQDVFPLLRITVFYHSILVMCLHFVVSVTASYFCKSSNENVDASLIHPYSRRFLPKTKSPTDPPEIEELFQID